MSNESVTPKEYAESLFESFKDFAFYSCKETQESSVEWNAKQCCLVTIDKIIEAIWGDPFKAITHEYYEAVKKHIEAL